VAGSDPWARPDARQPAIDHSLAGVLQIERSDQRNEKAANRRL
jgi:hypothetical protein